MSSAVWWAVACSEEVTSDKPINVSLGDQPVVLWRDNQGVARALEDRCPHRRAPLSLGCVRESGAIQCGYHGWTFDGEKGQLIEIPNLKSDVKYPPVYRAKAFGVAESGGFVRVCLDAKATPPAQDGDPLPLSGKEIVALDHEQYIAALFDDPSLILSIRGVKFSPYLISELANQDGQLVLERSCQWSTQYWPSPFTSEFPITLRIGTDPITGETDLTLLDEDFNLLLHATLTPVPAARGTTQVCWRAIVAPDRPGLQAKALGVGNPLSVHPHINGEALRVLKPSASIHAADLRKVIAENSETQVAAA